MYYEIVRESKVVDLEYTHGFGVSYPAEEEPNGSRIPF
jgi:hypothetical protein